MQNLVPAFLEAASQADRMESSGLVFFESFKLGDAVVVFGVRHGRILEICPVYKSFQATKVERERRKTILSSLELMPEENARMNQIYEKKDNMQIYKTLRSRLAASPNTTLSGDCTHIVPSRTALLPLA